MTDQELIKKVWDTGHFWNPANPNTHNVQEADLPTLQLTDPVVQEAIASYQQSDINMVGLVKIYHQRPPVFDGIAGPATRQLALIERCPMPDHVPPPHVAFNFEDPGLQAAVQSFQQWAASGSGSWPPSGCDPQRQGIHSFRVRINLAGSPAAVRAYIEQSLEAVTAAYADIGVAVRYILDDSSPAEIVKHFERMGGSVIGWNYFPQPNTCNQITGAYSNSFAPSFQAWANLEGHETGHGVGLQHTNGGIMNPSLTVVWPFTWRGDVSFNRLKGFFGGEPITPIPPPPPPPPVNFDWKDVV